MKWSIAIVLLKSALLVTSAASASQSLISGEIERLRSGSWESCLSELIEKATLYSRISEAVHFRAKTLDLSLEAHRLMCESRRLEKEARRLTGERARLLSEVERIERLRRAARSSIRPDEMYKSLSQKRMLRDSDALEGTIATLGSVAGQLERESTRIWRLSVDTLADLPKERRHTLTIALDAEAQNDILIRLLGDRSKG